MTKRLDRSLYKKGQQMTGGPAYVTKGMPKRVVTNKFVSESAAYNKLLLSLKTLKLSLIRDQLKR